MKSMIEILEETKSFYNENPDKRGYDIKSDSCLYRTEDGKMCAVGRCLSVLPVNQASAVGNTILLGLKDEYKGHPLQFWEDLQRFHDCKFHWTECGISEEGRNFYSSFVEKIKEGIYER